jgi:hypothetical protein
VARLAVGGLGPLDAETWVERTISSGANTSPRVWRSGSTLPKERGHWRSWDRSYSGRGPRNHRQDLETPEVPPTVRGTAARS